MLLCEEEQQQQQLLPLAGKPRRTLGGSKTLRASAQPKGAHPRGPQPLQPGQPSQPARRRPASSAQPLAAAVRPARPAAHIRATAQPPTPPPPAPQPPRCHTPPCRITNKDYGCFNPQRDVAASPYFPELAQASTEIYLGDRYDPAEDKPRLLFFAGGVRHNQQEYSGERRRRP
jgi:hypothetical protein